MSFKDVQQKILKLEDDFRQMKDYNVPEDFDVMKRINEEMLFLSEKVSSMKKKALLPDDVNVYGAKTRSQIMAEIPHFEELFSSITSKFEEISKKHGEFLVKEQVERETIERKVREAKELKEKELKLQQEELLKLQLEEEKQHQQELEVKLQKEKEIKQKERTETELKQKNNLLAKELIEDDAKYQSQLSTLHSLEAKVQYLCNENGIDQSNILSHNNDLLCQYTSLQNELDRQNTISTDQILNEVRSDLDSLKELTEYSIKNFPELCAKHYTQKKILFLKKDMIHKLSSLIKQKESDISNINQIIQVNRRKVEEIKKNDCNKTLLENCQKFIDQFPKENIFLSSSELFDLPIISPSIIEELTETTYINKIKNSHITCVVDWYMEGCPPCSMIAPDFERLSQDFPHIKFFRINGPNCVSISYGYGITSYPTFQFYHNGEIVSIITGANYDKLKENIEKINDKLTHENLEKILTYHEINNSTAWDGIEIPISTYWSQLRSSSDYSTALPVLSSIVDNLIKDPNNDKFRKLKRQNPKIQQLLSTDGSTQLLYSIGFKNKLIDKIPHLVLPIEVNIIKNKYIYKIKKLIDDGIRESEMNQSHESTVPTIPSSVPKSLVNDRNLYYLFQDPQIVQDLMMSPTVQSIQSNPQLRSRLISRDFDYFRNNPNFQNDPYLMRAMNRLIELRQQNVNSSQINPNTTPNRNIPDMTEDELIEEAIKQSKLEEEKRKDNKDNNF